MKNEANRDLLWILGSLTLLNLALTMYSLRVARSLNGHRNQYSTVAAVANIDNRKDSCVSMLNKQYDKSLKGTQICIICCARVEISIFVYVCNLL